MYVRNRRVTPLNSTTGSNLADMGRDRGRTIRASAVRVGSTAGLIPSSWWLRGRSTAYPQRAAGAKSGTSSVDRSVGERGNHRVRTRRDAASVAEMGGHVVLPGHPEGAESA